MSPHWLSGIIHAILIKNAHSLGVKCHSVIYQVRTEASWQTQLPIVLSIGLRLQNTAQRARNWTNHQVHWEQAASPAGHDGKTYLVLKLINTRWPLIMTSREQSFLELANSKEQGQTKGMLNSNGNAELVNLSTAADLVFKKMQGGGFLRPHFFKKEGSHQMWLHHTLLSYTLGYAIVLGLELVIQTIGPVNAWACFLCNTCPLT